MALAGCGIGSMEIQYYYLQLEGHSLSISQWGRASTRPLRAIYMKGHEDMPTMYSLTRDQYTISVELPMDTDHTRLFITARNSSEEQLLVSGRISDRCSYLTEESISDKLQNDEPAALLSLYWNRGHNSKCQIPGIHTYRRFPLKLLIWDTEGDLLGAEELTYRVLQNGVYVVLTGW